MRVDNLQKQFDDLKAEQSKHQSDQIPAKKVTNLIFKCEMCDFQTNSKQGLKTHIARKHTKLSNEVFPKKCELCNRDIENSTEMKKHLISHSYKCSSKLKYKCDECDFWGPNELTLEMHVRKYHSENITCGMCECEAKDSENLEIHTFTCEIFQCNFCYEKFKNVQEMKTHWRNDHDGKSITIKHFKRERDNHEFFEDNFYNSGELFKKK